MEAPRSPTITVLGGRRWRHLSQEVDGALGMEGDAEVEDEEVLESEVEEGDDGDDEDVGGVEDVEDEIKRHEHCSFWVFDDLSGEVADDSVW